MKSREMPLECKIRKELEIKRCLACSDKCCRGISDLKNHIRFKIREEAEREWELLTMEIDWE